MVNDKPEYSYLATPIINLISDLEKSISFNKYFIQEATVRELKKQRDLVKQKYYPTKHVLLFIRHLKNTSDYFD